MLHMCLIAHKLRSRLCYTLTKITFLISVMILILFISGVNLLQFFRHKLQQVKLIYYTFMMHMPTSTDALTDTVFSPVELLHGSRHSFTVSKCQFKFGNLQIFCYYSNEKPLTGLWETIPCHLEDDFITSISAMKLRITGSRVQYVSKHFVLNTCKILILLYP